MPAALAIDAIEGLPVFLAYLAFALVGLVGYVTQITPLALGVVAAALFAAFLNAAFGFCLGCEMFLIIRRLLPAAR